MTRFGVDTEPAALAGHRVLYGGPLGDTRFFFGPGKPPSWNAWPLTLRGPGERPVVSFKTWYPAAFTAMVDNAPCDWVACYDHEPESEIVSGAQTVTRLQQVYAAMRHAVDTTANAYQCKVAPILNWYQATQRGFDWDRLAPLFGLADVVGVDTYALRLDALSRNTYTAPDALFGPMLDLCDAYEVPVAIPEFGMTLASDLNAVRMAEQMVTYAGYLTASGAPVEWVSYFCNQNDGYHLEDPPGREDAVRVWKSFMAASRGC